MLQLKNISKTYSGKPAISKIDLRINEGDFIGLIGANGAGKSTLMKIILGLIPKYEGEIIWRGQKITSQNKLDLLRETKALVETPQFFPHITGEENLEYFSKLDGTFDKGKVRAALEFVNLLDAKDKQFRQYSLGMKQKLGIARVFSTDCSFIILDEPFNGLDPLAKEEMKHILKRLYDEGKTLLVSSHLLEELEELSSRIIYLDSGKLEKDVIWDTKMDSLFEITINPHKEEDVKRFLDNMVNEYEFTFQSEKITLKIARELLPSFLEKLALGKIEFYEVSDVTKKLKKYFDNEGEVY
ncbi:hypothetical protein CEW92_11675 [Bacillaceae bacterium SAS-127]|nr:hypothetical protein CEW92_11675 [Bacillaceae bacterium SAS-127]